MDLTQSHGFLVDSSYSIFQSCKISFYPFMFPLQCLNTCKILPIIVCRKNRIFLCNPGNSLISISVKSLNLMSSKQFLLSLRGQRLQSCPSFQQLSFLVADYLRLRMLLCGQFVSSLTNVRDSELLACHILLELIKLPLQNLHMLQIMTKLFSSDRCFFVIDPEHNLITLTKKLNEDKCLLKPHSFLGKFAQEELPEPVQLIQSLANGHLLEVLLVDHLHACVIQNYNSIAMGSNFCFKCLVLLNFSLQISRVFVVLIACSLEFLVDPRLQI